MSIVVLGCLLAPAWARQAVKAQPTPNPAPWLDPSLGPDVRATLLERAMSLDDMLALVDGKWAVPHTGARELPARALGSAGFVAGVERLGIPDLQETDGSVGVAEPVVPDERRPVRGVAGYATSLPSGLATAATWNPNVAYAGGAMIASEARDQGFNVLLAGAVNLARDPRNGRTFEYAGEDPLLAGTIVGSEVRGIQDRHVISTVKHFAFNDQETDRHAVSADIAPRAGRESDLLAFEIAIERGRPGAVMCAYNRVNAVDACGSDDLLNGTLKGDWKFPGWVMSDWGAVAASTDAASGLDQESGDSFDPQAYFGAPLRAAIGERRVSQARLADMVRRILRSMFAAGLFDRAQTLRPLDANADAEVAQADEEQAAVLLKNRAALLPLDHRIASVAVIGQHADVGVLAGGGSSQVWPLGGPALEPSNFDFPNPELWDPSSPLDAIRTAARNAHVTFYNGDDPAAAASYAASAAVAIVFVNQWTAESIDAGNLSLPGDQDALVERVASANPHTVVVLETGGPVTMPWLARVRAVLEAWYPGARGGTAIARLLFGDVSPSGRLPVTFPQSVAQLPRAVIPSTRVDYNVEGADVGYRWYESRRLRPLFGFGFGLTYSRFRYSHLRVLGGSPLRVRFGLQNIGSRGAMEVAQVYLQLPAGSGADAPRLAAFTKVALAAGQSRSVELTLDQRIEATFDVPHDDWQIVPGRYRIVVGPNEREAALSTWTTLRARRLPP